ILRFRVRLKNKHPKPVQVGDAESVFYVGYFAGPCASCFGITMALKLSATCFGQVLAVTVTVLFCMLGCPLLSNSAFTKPSPPTGIGSFDQSGTVQPHVGCAL